LFILLTIYVLDFEESTYSDGQSGNWLPAFLMKVACMLRFVPIVRAVRGASLGKMLTIIQRSPLSQYSLIVVAGGLCDVTTKNGPFVTCNWENMTIIQRFPLSQYSLVVVTGGICDVTTKNGPFVTCNRENMTIFKRSPLSQYSLVFVTGGICAVTTKNGLFVTCNWENSDQAHGGRVIFVFTINFSCIYRSVFIFVEPVH